MTASSVAAAPASVGGHDPRPATVAAPLPGPGPQRSGRQLRVACPWFFLADKEAATVRAARTESVCAGPGVTDRPAYAMNVREPFGIWGGPTEGERAASPRAGPRARSPRRGRPTVVSLSVVSLSVGGT